MPRGLLSKNSTWDSPCVVAIDIALRSASAMVATLPGYVSCMESTPPMWSLLTTAAAGPVEGSCTGREREHDVREDSNY